MDDGIPCERNDPEAKEENLIKAVGLNDWRLGIG